jgi:hypothetical protein
VHGVSDAARRVHGFAAIIATLFTEAFGSQTAARPSEVALAGLA